MPPSIQRSNAKHYKSAKTITEIKEYDGMPHLSPAQKGWEDVADDALAWAVEHARWSAPTSSRQQATLDNQRCARSVTVQLRSVL
ncbi:hypothetical protein AB0H36_05920 [Kribbella sp. NPDC050820]|uniref:hypothetical protein n=1 Tax=Kribbella sp. NPDC050820 TaxID=3155408 RepID=UPI0033F09243